MEHLNKTVGKYRLTRFIGEGGMASVYVGTHEKLGTKVAVKILNPVLTANKQIRQRFENEAKFMATLDHPNITRVIDYDEQPDMLAIIMELLTGQDLSTLIKSKGALKPEQALPLFFQVLDAFRYAHAKGIVHRDIKPSNIFINAGNQVKILDFGIAKILGPGDDFTHTGQQIGTPVYMSPEQVRAEKNIDHRSDIYSLGVTLYFMLLGKPPYDSSTQSNFEIFNKIVFEPIPDLPGFPAINAIIKRAVAKDPAQRYRDAGEFKEALLTISPATGSNLADNTADDKTLIDYPDVDRPAQEVDPETELWEQVKDSGNAKDLNKYIRKYPGGKYRQQAESELRKINDSKPTEKKPSEGERPGSKRILLYLGALAIILFIAVKVFLGWRENNMWEIAKRVNTIEAYENYLGMGPQRKYFTIAQDCLHIHQQRKLLFDLLSSGRKEDYQTFLQLYPDSPYKQQVMDSIASIIRQDSIQRYQAYLNSPEGRAEQLVLGSHPLTLQWISWDYSGEINIYKENGEIRANGSQRGRGKEAGDYVKVSGTISIVNDKHLRLTGTIETRISHINQGNPCIRTGTFNFKATGGRKYWRMQEMDNPCDNVVDYVDIYFSKL